ncbi:MAG: tripartite tricarboxylate transporter TctB family protein [Candidatus Rokubacteria bacterium]|nr:tripartite tricarboxylate transporter TctB family protein [Candidatus Rokubacteria bacterium]
MSSQRLVGLALLVLGAGSLVETFRIKDDWSGARLMPLLVAVALLALGVAHVVSRAPAMAPPAAGERADIGRVVLALSVLVAYVALFTTLGFFVATAALLLVLVGALGRYRWPVTAGLALGLAVACHVVFRVWLGMPLPDGLLGP